jgi:Tricarboxylate carrier.
MQLSCVKLHVDLQCEVMGENVIHGLSLCVLQRYVPFAAVAAANCVNIPLMRQNELLYGIDVYDENDNKVTQSRVRLVCLSYGRFGGQDMFHSG